MARHATPEEWQGDLQRVLKADPLTQGIRFWEGRIFCSRIEVKKREITVVLSTKLFPIPETQEALAARKRLYEASLEATKDKDFRVRISACETLGSLGDERAREVLQGIVQQDNKFVQAKALWALHMLDEPRVRTMEGIALQILPDGRLVVTNFVGEAVFRNVRLTPESRIAPY